VNFADYVLENYTDVESKFPLTLWPQPVEIGRMCLLGATPHTNNVAEAYHSHLNSEFYVKDPNMLYTCLSM